MALSWRWQTELLSTPGHCLRSKSHCCEAMNICSVTGGAKSGFACWLQRVSSRDSRVSMLVSSQQGSGSSSRPAIECCTASKEVRKKINVWRSWRCSLVMVLFHRTFPSYLLASLYLPASQYLSLAQLNVTEEMIDLKYRAKKIVFLICIFGDDSAG